MTSFKHWPLLLALAGLTAGCSGMQTTMTKIGRMGQNQGYEVAADLPAVRQASIEVLKARGYQASVKADPENGAEGAGQIVIGQRVVKYNAEPGIAASTPGSPKQMDTRDLVDVYLSKKWQLGSSQAAPNITLVDFAGGSYLRKGAGAEEEETPLTKDFISLLRDEIERKVNAAKIPKTVVE